MIISIYCLFFFCEVFIDFCCHLYIYQIAELVIRLEVVSWQSSCPKEELLICRQLFLRGVVEDPVWWIL